MDIPLNISINPSPSICQLGVYSWVSVNQALASIFQWKKAGTYLFIYLLPNKTQDHQATWEIPEPEETQPNLSGLSEEVDGYKKPLLVPRLQFFVELKQRQEVHSGSLLHGRRKTVDFSFLKKSTMWELQAKFYLEQNKDYSPGAVSQRCLKCCLSGHSLHILHQIKVNLQLSHRAFLFLSWHYQTILNSND